MFTFVRLSPLYVCPLYWRSYYYWKKKNTCGVRTNFRKTIRMNKIVKRAIMSLICTIKTIVGSPVFRNKLCKPITIVMVILVIIMFA